MPFDPALDRVLALEGGYSDHQADSGGRTRFGITEAVARANGYKGPMHLMPMDLARRIYRTEYWDRLHLDEIDRLAPDVAYQVFDAAVNCGTGMAGGWLQRALNVLNRGGADYADLTVDGAVGAKTIAAVRAFLKARPAQGARVLLKAIRALQGVHYITLAERRPKDEAFVVGWLDHRI